MSSTQQEQECCPKLDPTIWDGVIHEWKEKKFLIGQVGTFFYMPLNFGSVIKKLNEKVDQANASITDWLCLSDHTSLWKMNIYLAVNKEIPGAKNITLSGKYISKVYEGSFNNTGKWCKDFESYAKTKNLKIEKLYMWYTTCPKCAKKYGKNYVVIVGKVDSQPS